MSEKMLIDADRVLSKFEQWNREDASRASDAAETRQDIGEFTEATGYNAKALSDGRKLLKMWQKDPDKYADYLRTFKPLLQDVMNHCEGQSTPDMFDPDAETPTMDDSEAERVHEESLGGDRDEEPAPESNVTPFNPDIDAEAAEFDDAADEAFAEG